MVPARCVLAFLLTMAPGLLQPVHACGLEPAFNDALKVSHPGALAVAVAVAEARRSGLLPQANPTAAPDEIRRERMLADLRRLQSHLGRNGVQVNRADTGSFSVVLVGPGLWSRYHLTSEGVTAEYHTQGPHTDEVVVLMHDSVLRALLDDSLSARQAAGHGLIAFSGNDSWPVRHVFENSFRVTTRQQADLSDLRPLRDQTGQTLKI